MNLICKKWTSGDGKIFRFTVSFDLWIEKKLLASFPSFNDYRIAVIFCSLKISQHWSGLMKPTCPPVSQFCFSIYARKCLIVFLLQKKIQKFLANTTHCNPVNYFWLKTLTMGNLKRCQFVSFHTMFPNFFDM